MMKPVIPALAELIDNWGPNTNIQMGNLFTFSLQGGEMLTYSGYQTALRAPAPNTASPLFTFYLGPGFKLSKTSVKIGVEVSETDIELYAGANDVLGLGGTLTWQQAMSAGLFDGAECKIWRAFITPDYNVVGTVSVFFGRVGDIEIGRTKTLIRVKSMLDLLTVQMPRRLFQATCNHIFGGSMCGYDRINGLNASGVPTGIGRIFFNSGPGSNPTQVNTGGFMPFPTGAEYDNGSIIGVSGANAGYTRTIGKIGGGIVYFLKPFLFPVVVGDSFNLLPGCPLTQSACSDRQNSARYGGFPAIPPPESAV
jgi:Uncharacterized conserved protein (DUF2163)/Phage conserved hypothetical protein BR0599